MNNNPIIMLIPSLSGGGAERVAINIVPYLSNHFDVTVALLDENIAYPIDESISYKAFSRNLEGNLSHIIRIPYHIFSLAWLIRETKAQVVLSILEQANIINILTKALIKHKAIISQHVEPVRQYSGKGILGKVIFNSSRLLYRYSDKIVCVSKAIKEIVGSNYNIPADKMRVIYNPVDTKRDFKEKKVVGISLPERYILHVGRMRLAHKAQDILLKAFAMVRSSTPNIKLVLLGLGPDQGIIKQLAQELGLKNDVVFAGWQENITSIMRQAEMLVLSSRYEGLPMVIVEALASGCPVVSTDCPTGPREILGNNEYGLLVPVENPTALAESMKRLLNYESLRKYYSKQGIKRAMDFDLEKIGREYVDLLKGI